MEWIWSWKKQETCDPWNIDRAPHLETRNLGPLMVGKCYEMVQYNKFNLKLKCTWTIKSQLLALSFDKWIKVERLQPQIVPTDKWIQIQIKIKHKKKVSMCKFWTRLNLWKLMFKDFLLLQVESTWVYLMYIVNVRIQRFFSKQRFTQLLRILIRKSFHSVQCT